MSKYKIVKYVQIPEGKKCIFYAKLQNGVIFWSKGSGYTWFEKEEAATFIQILNKFSETGSGVSFSVEPIKEYYTLQTSGKIPDDILYLCQLDKKVYDCELDVCVNIFWTRKSENALRVDKDTVKSYVKIIESLLNITPFVVTVDYDVLT